MIYNGDCNFCRLWIHRWQLATGERLDYLPFQDPCVPERFPEVPHERFETAVQLIETDGRVYGGAEAVFRALAHNPHDEWLLDWYEHSPVFAHVTEWGYRLVARHRSFFSFLTRLAWGRHVERPTHDVARWVFLRSLGAIYLIAFVSLWTQVIGLVGSQGILPANSAIEAMRLAADAQHVGLGRYHLVPTLCWFDTTDRFLNLQCAAGVVLSVLLIIGIAPAPCLFLLWLIYLSLATICRTFLSYQWDNLLLEAGFLAIFLAPLQLWPRLARVGPPSRLVLWLLRWLLFKLMFQSGLVKLISGDPTWRNLTALTYHYETQPLPTWIGWYAYQLPVWVQKVCTGAMFGIELLVPFLIFAPRRPRQLAGLVMAAFQVLILLTGNYCFFNLLTIALCLILFDDAALRPLLPRRLRNALGPAEAWATGTQRLPPSAGACGLPPTTVGSNSPDASVAHSADPPDSGPPHPAPQPSTLAHRRWPVQFTVPLAIIAIVTSLIQFSVLFRLRVPWPGPVLATYMWLEPFRTFNRYGLFAVMTTTRNEIVIEGSNDGATWRAYEFKYKPGDVKRRPGFVEPLQPRLDWQMWFAALGSFRQNPWFVTLCTRLLEGSRPVLALFKSDPFPGVPPRYIRAVVYDYHFTDIATRRHTGAWWRRREIGLYLPPVSLHDVRDERMRAARPLKSVGSVPAVQEPLAGLL